MKLIRLRIQNFRCYKDEIMIDFDDMEALLVGLHCRRQQSALTNSWNLK